MKKRSSGFIEKITDRDKEFIMDIQTFIQPLIGPGRVNSLTQTLIEMYCAGSA